jgi:hypothetical protein
MTSWSGRERVVASLVVLYLFVQVLVPTVMLVRPRPQRFGWQMFASVPRFPWLVLHRQSGARDTVPLETYFANRRADIDTGFLALVPPHVCRVLPDVEAVEIRLPGDTATIAARCP